jgi:YHYH protein/SLA1 homology domain 1, SHD1
LFKRSEYRLATFINQQTFMRIFLFVLLLAVPILLLAHHSQTPESTRTWRYANKSVAAQGDFVFYENGHVHISNTQHQTISLPVNALSWVDKNYVEKQSAQIEKLNLSQSVQPKSATNTILIGGFLVMVFLFIGFRVASVFQVRYLKQALAFSMVLLMFACKKAIVDTVVSSIKSDPTVMSAAFVPYKALVTTRWDDTYFYIESNGLPAHNMMVGITNWQQQVPVNQPYTSTNAWSIPLAPTLATSPLSIKTNFMKGAIAIATNGIPIFNPLNNRSEDSYLIGELDQWGGHCGKADDYHYHIPPMHLQATSGNLPIAYALDGFAVYGTKEPDGSAMQTLDDYHGHTGSNGVYHYHGTTTYPYLMAAMRGNVATDVATPAPENQILPQAKMFPIRPAGDPLKGASITAFKTTGTNAYSLDYAVNNQKANISYSWDNANNYTFIVTGTDGKTTTSKYIRK